MAKKKNVEKQQKVVAPQQAESTPAKADKKQKKAAQKQQKPVEKPKSAGKTKQIKKEQKPSKPVKQQKPVAQPQKKVKAAKKQETNVQIFTPDFYKRLNTFQTYYKQVLELKSSASGSDLSDELSTVNTRVRQALQQASSKILKQELISLQQWIQGQQRRLKAEILTVEQCLEQSQKSLESTKAFTVDQVQSQLKLIQKRINEKQSQLDHYGVLLSRSQGIYQQGQEQKVQVQAVNNNNAQAENVAQQDLELDLQ